MTRLGSTSPFQGVFPLACPGGTCRAESGSCEHHPLSSCSRESLGSPSRQCRLAQSGRDRGPNLCKHRGRSSKRREAPHEKEGADGGGSLCSAPLKIPGCGVAGTAGLAPGLPSSAEPEAEPDTEAVELPPFKGLRADHTLPECSILPGTAVPSKDPGEGGSRAGAPALNKN